MELKIAHNDPQGMSQDGDAILRSLQNKSLPMVDLMVRESLQNSLDATLEGAKETIVDFKIGKFSTDRVAYHLNGITEKLLKKYKGLNQFISISDKNTSGLTGNYRTNNQEDLDKSNFQKLVFGIGKNQEKDGAGGSWGLGKTSYFRMGIGLVIYYTRIKNGPSYEERLIVSLIESPKQKYRLLEESERGIAWWGKKDETYDKIYPITNSSEIKEFLKIFGMMPYTGNDTGTTIIVPFVSEKNKALNVEEDNLSPWEQSYSSSIKMAVQRWYNPRIFNQSYVKHTGNSMLRCTVNGDLISPLNMEPTFEIISRLYSGASNPTKKNENFEVKPIYVPLKALKNKKEPVGYVAFGQFTRSNFKMDAPDNKKSPIEYLGIQDSSKNAKKMSSVMAYSRKPGMIVEYSTDGKWIPKNLNIEENHILLAFFVPNSNAQLSDLYRQRGYKTLEQYLRASENADHANWLDESGITLIHRIQKYTSREISEYYQARSESSGSSALSGISRKVGQLIMPPSNFGKASTNVKEKKVKTRKSTGPLNRTAGISVLSSTPIDKHHVEVKTKITLKKEAKNTISIKLQTQEKSIDPKDWERSMGVNVPFPIQIEHVQIKKLFGKEVNIDSRKFNQEYMSFDFTEANRGIFEINTDTKSEVELEVDILLIFKSHHYQPIISIKSDKLEGGN